MSSARCCDPDTVSNVIEACCKDPLTPKPKKPCRRFKTSSIKSYAKRLPLQYGLMAQMGAAHPDDCKTWFPAQTYCRNAVLLAVVATKVLRLYDVVHVLHDETSKWQKRVSAAKRELTIRIERLYSMCHTSNDHAHVTNFIAGLPWDIPNALTDTHAECMCPSVYLSDLDDPTQPGRLITKEMVTLAWIARTAEIAAHDRKRARLHLDALELRRRASIAREVDEFICQGLEGCA